MDFLRDKFSYENQIVISGLTKELEAFYVSSLFVEKKRSVLVLTSTLYEANQFYATLKNYTDHVLLFPMDDFLTSVALAVSPELKLTRLETLEKIQNEDYIVVTNLMGYLRYLPSKKDFKESVLKLKVNQDISREDLVNSFQRLGYHRESLVTSTGEYGVRGFIVDIFMTKEEHPLRFEFFGDTIESIRYFDESSQLSLEGVQEVSCYPIEEIVSERASSLYEIMNEPWVVFKDSSQIQASYKKLEEDAFIYSENEGLKSSKRFFYAFDEICPTNFLSLESFLDHPFKDRQVFKYEIKNLENFRSNFDKLKDFVTSNLYKKKKVLFCLTNDTQIKTIQELFQGNVKLIKNASYLKEGISILRKKIGHGFIFDDVLVISAYDIELIKDKEIKYKNSYRMGRKVNSLDALSIGDYVVHRSHGIGIYHGVVTLNQHGIKKDYLQIDYQGTDKVYVPVEKISTIFKYTDKDGLKPKINKLNSTSWEYKKRAIQKRIHDISEELIALYAKRSSIKGESFKTYPEESLFGSDFIYQETKDQLKAIADIDKDLQSSIPMDRLLCGDVGFGKTEVAFRAMFKTICNSKQVMYLCPTTILSKQQYESAQDRFKNFPVEIALLNRFTTPKEAKRILEGLKSGVIDIVFGTHRLLSDDISFKRLGLLVVDEEQRFGVTHKEKIKKFKNDVNVLTLSATPIPRTMKMAMSGLRDLSIIDTAPVNRYPVQTYVVQEQDLLIKDAIYKELARDGQIFILYNKIASIDSQMEHLKHLVPAARIVYAHGQMSKMELENIMASFINHEYDILLCTTIIETGIDIPNANTLIIYDADHFGLSQLYQIRGRVGRSDKIAYAYLLYDKSKVLNEAAVKRLQAIREFTELGSGYRIAMRDLSIRGAGDLLGSEQAGFVDSVGISLYMKMVEEEIKRLNGEQVLEEENEKPSLVRVETHIPDSYIHDEDLKIEVHQMINEIDSFAKLQQVKAEIEDRFGKVSEEIEIYMYEEWFEKLAEGLKLEKVVQNERLVSISLPVEVSNQIKADKLFLEAYNIHQKFQFKYVNQQIIISLPLQNLQKHFLYFFVPLLELILHDMESA